MNFLTSVCISLLLIASLGATLAAQTPAAFVCETTEPVADRPAANVDPFGKDTSVYYEDGIWVSIPGDGVLELAPDRDIAFGIYQGWRTETFTWLRDKGVEGFIVVSGERLDEESDLQPQTPLSPQRQYVQVGWVETGIAFPDEGCWEVTGTVGHHSITWVMDVRFVDVVATPTL